MLAPRWAFDPLSGAGAARAGGRWNEPGQPALYLSNSHTTAIAEYQQHLPRPGTLTAYDVTASRILDLANPDTRHAIGLDETFLRQAWKHVRDVERRRPTSWDFSAAAFANRWHGLRVPSVQATGWNLVLWRWNTELAPLVRYIDPLRDLPRDQASWKRDTQCDSPIGWLRLLASAQPATVSIASAAAAWHGSITATHAASSSAVRRCAMPVQPRMTVSAPACTQACAASISR